jgi:hypothetical protein
MFKNHPDPMRMEPTPERVLAVCKMVAKQPISKNDLSQIMTLGTDNQDIAASISVALEELHVIDQIDGSLTVVVPTDVLATPASFRQFVSSMVFKNSDTSFFRFTKWFISQNERIFTLGAWEVFATTARSESSLLEGLNENAVLGWRFWAAYLGIGYLNRTILIPNMTIRIRDVLATSFSNMFSYDTSIRAQDFLSWVAAEIPEVDYTQGSLPLAFSAGLRTLHELKLIELQTQRDTDFVRLYHVDGDSNNSFSHIVVREVIGG